MFEKLLGPVLDISADLVQNLSPQECRCHGCFQIWIKLQAIDVDDAGLCST